MTNILKNKKSIIAAAAMSLILIIFRTVQLAAWVEYPSGLEAIGCEAMNLAFNTTMLVFAAVLSVLVCLDIRNTQIKTVNQIPDRAAQIIGVAMIIGGSATALSVITQITASVNNSPNANLYILLASITGCAAYIGAGMSAFSSSRIKPSSSIAIVAVIISYLFKCVIFYLSNPIITNIPQRLMLMIFYAVTVVFWMNIGRFFSCGEKRYTLAAVIASGFALGSITLSYSLSGIFLMAIESDKWLSLTNTADAEIFITGLVPSVIAAVLLVFKKRQAEETVEINTDEHPNLQAAQQITPAAKLSDSDINNIFDDFSNNA